MTNGDINSQLPMFIVDVLRHDVVENLDSIIVMLNNAGCIGWREFWPHDFTKGEVVKAMNDLIRKGFIKVLQETNDKDELVDADALKPIDADDVWFALTPKAWEAWNHWQPPTEELAHAVSKGAESVGG